MISFLKTALKLTLLFILCIIAYLVIHEKWLTVHCIKFDIEDQYKIRLTADECGSCFLDWPIDYQLDVYDRKHKRKSRFYFSTGDGPFLQFNRSNKGTAEILISGYRTNEAISWLLDLQSNEINRRYLKQEQLNDYTPYCRLTQNFEIEYLQ